jgi:hypothetical protein
MRKVGQFYSTVRMLERSKIHKKETLTVSFNMTISLKERKR